MKNLFPDVETTIKIKLGGILEKLTQSHNRRESARFDMSQDDCENEICASTQFLQIDLQESLERYCNVLPVFGFSSAKYDHNLIKSSLLPILVNERDIELTFYQESESVHLIQVWWYSVIGYIELCWRSNRPWFILEGIQNIKNRRIFPLRMVWSPWQNAEHRTFPTIWRLLQ